MANVGQDAPARAEAPVQLPDDRVRVRDQADVRRARFGPDAWNEVADCDPAAFTLTAMRDRIDVVGDLTAGMWRRKVSLRPRFAKLGLEPPA